MENRWTSIGLYQHPARHNVGIFGNVILSNANVYFFRSGSANRGCPQEWAAKIHKEEGDEKESAIIIRNVPLSVRRNLKSKAAKEGKSMQSLILELITRYTTI